MRDEGKPRARPPVARPSSNIPRPDTEFDFISRIKRRVDAARGRARADGLVLGIGDDAAVINGRGRLDSVITADLLVEDVDFRRTSLPHDIGYKALAVSLSDIAAMGARPRWALLSLGLPQAVY